ncbi:hypothetical protein A2Z22_03385 [Candidatus Woesebacteria bacterium RBG_16_34_12]|uniref:Bifunctional phosphoribosylaminoimidazolecarboxamide formyltransferase/inosine monophosphate cyclohydrolase n=1 Tax=Candidatus Woesebacteria bacterium RBG_16_34_12 TaxID=1802480 RepID=A0A1F7XAS1_9BACT|nr:MAG: hypothetical protein A2Z22_03385 [Candidatus Woesebacteria bacterium RBG_16_34_12]
MKKYNLSYHFSIKLRYGENPHQKGWAWREKTADSLAFFNFQQLQGKELSFNNYLDIDASVTTLTLIGQKNPSGVVIKHGNPCGASIDRDINKAFIKAWNGDSLAAFGGIVAINRIVSSRLAKIMLANKRFFEVLVCPGISKSARTTFSYKPNLRILVNSVLKKPVVDITHDIKKIRGGLLVQERDVYQLKDKDLKVMTKKKPTKKQVSDLIFAWKICQVSKANCIVLAKNKQLIASGVGQQDRVRCTQLAVTKAGKRAKNTVVASDAFFPFPDGPTTLINAGVKAIIQPGGSIRDQQAIDVCDKNKVAMIFTGIRCFRH